MWDTYYYQKMRSLIKIWSDDHILSPSHWLIDYSLFTNCLDLIWFDFFWSFFFNRKNHINIKIMRKEPYFLFHSLRIWVDANYLRRNLLLTEASSTGARMDKTPKLGDRETFLIPNYRSPGRSQKRTVQPGFFSFAVEIPFSLEGWDLKWDFLAKWKR